MLSLAALRVLRSLHHYAVTNHCWPSATHIAKDLKKDRTTIQHHLRTLRKENLAVLKKAGQESEWMLTPRSYQYLSHRAQPPFIDLRPPSHKLRNMPGRRAQLTKQKNRERRARAWNKYESTLSPRYDTLEA